MSFWTLCVLFFCVFLWEKERTLHVRKNAWELLGSFISHRAHRVHGAFRRTVSSPQRASGIQRTQSITAKEGCWEIVVRCWWLAIGVSRWSLPFPSGEGKGEGPTGEGGGVYANRNANYTSSKCKEFSLTTPFYNRKGAEFETRRGPSTFKNMPFLHQEGRLLRARRACSQILFVIYWFRVGYKVCYRECYIST